MPDLQVKLARQNDTLVRRVIDSFEEPLASRQTKAVQFQYENWNETGPKFIGPLIG